MTTPPDPAALAALLPLRRQLREIKGLRELRPGVFELRGSRFIELHADGRSAELKKPGGSGYDPYPIDTPPAQRKLVDDARRRAAHADED